MRVYLKKKNCYEFEDRFIRKASNSIEIVYAKKYIHGSLMRTRVKRIPAHLY